MKKKSPPDKSGGETKNHGVIFSNLGGRTAKGMFINLYLIPYLALCLQGLISNRQDLQRHQKLFFLGYP